MKWIAIIFLNSFVLFAGFVVFRGVLLLPEMATSNIGAWMSCNVNLLAFAFGVLAALGAFKPTKLFVESFGRRK